MLPMNLPRYVLVLYIKKLMEPIWDTVVIWNLNHPKSESNAETLAAAKTEEAPVSEVWLYVLHADLEYSFHLFLFPIGICHYSRGNCGRERKFRNGPEEKRGRVGRFVESLRVSTGNATFFFRFRCYIYDAKEPLYPQRKLQRIKINTSLEYLVVYLE